MLRHLSMTPYVIGSSTGCVWSIPQLAAWMILCLFAKAGQMPTSSGVPSILAASHSTGLSVPNVVRVCQRSACSPKGGSSCVSGGLACGFTSWRSSTLPPRIGCQARMVAARATSPPVGVGNSAVVVDLPRWGPMLSPRVPNHVPIPGPRMERVTPGQRPRPNYGHPHALRHRGSGGR